MNQAFTVLRTRQVLDRSHAQLELTEEGAVCRVLNVPLSARLVIIALKALCPLSLVLQVNEKRNLLSMIT